MPPVSRLPWSIDLRYCDLGVKGGSAAVVIFDGGVYGLSMMTGSDDRGGELGSAGFAMIYG
eukprot:6508221-Ditylum_brightwellii.AAC.1